MSQLPDNELDLISQIPMSQRSSKATIPRVAVWLNHNVDFITSTGCTHFPEGPALIPADLSKLLFRNRSAVLLKHVKRAPSPKSSRH